MNKRSYWFLTLALLLSTTTYLKAQESVGPAPQKGMYESLAILPFKVSAASNQALSEDSVFGLQIQQAFYNSYLNDQKRWAIAVQDWQVTDSLLQKAGINLRKAGLLDKTALAKLLNVDVVITGEVYGFRTAAYVTPQGSGRQRLNAVDIFVSDGHTDDLLWQFRYHVRQELLIGNFYRLNENLYKAFTKRFPFTP